MRGRSLNGGGRRFGTRRATRLRRPSRWTARSTATGRCQSHFLGPRIKRLLLILLQIPGAVDGKPISCGGRLHISDFVDHRVKRCRCCSPEHPSNRPQRPKQCHQQDARKRSVPFDVLAYPQIRQPVRLGDGRLYPSVTSLQQVSLLLCFALRSGDRKGETVELVRQRDHLVQR